METYSEHPMCCLVKNIRLSYGQRYKLGLGYTQRKYSFQQLNREKHGILSTKKKILKQHLQDTAAIDDRTTAVNLLAFPQSHKSSNSPATASLTFIQLSPILSQPHQYNIKY